MVIWTPQGDSFYEKCRLLGATYFPSPEAMKFWAQKYIGSLDSVYYISLSTLTTLIESIRGSVTYRDLFAPLLRALMLLLTVIQSLYWRIDRFKVSHSPVRLFPKSLHPIDAMTNA